MRKMRLVVGIVLAASAAAVLLLGAASLVQAQTPGGEGSPRERHQELLAQKLGVSVDQLKTAQRAARDQLVDEALASGKITQDQATRLKSSEPGAEAGRRAGAAKALIGKILDAAAGVIGISRDEVRSGLKDGQSLGEIANSQGIGREQLKSGLQADLQRRINEAQAKGTINQEQATRLTNALNQHLDQVIDRKAGMRGTKGLR